MFSVDWIFQSHPNIETPKNDFIIIFRVYKYNHKVFPIHFSSIHLDIYTLIINFSFTIICFECIIYRINHWIRRIWIHFNQPKLIEYTQNYELNELKIIILHTIHNNSFSNALLNVVVIMKPSSFGLDKEYSSSLSKFGQAKDARQLEGERWVWVSDEELDDNGRGWL